MVMATDHLSLFGIKNKLLIYKQYFHFQQFECLMLARALRFMKVWWWGVVRLLRLCLLLGKLDLRLSDSSINRWEGKGVVWASWNATFELYPSVLVERWVIQGNRTFILTKRVIQFSGLLPNHSVTDTLLSYWQIRLHIVRYLRFYSCPIPQVDLGQKTH
jgi:hypothetical protein